MPWRKDFKRERQKTLRLKEDSQRAELKRLSVSKELEATRSQLAPESEKSEKLYSEVEIAKTELASTQRSLEQVQIDLENTRKANEEHEKAITAQDAEVSAERVGYLERIRELESQLSVSVLQMVVRRLKRTMRGVWTSIWVTGSRRGASSEDRA
jgi:septal ring factor EnvC (AmiA/AmiB activator)